jgi:hypothetical protein
LVVVVVMMSEGWSVDEEGMKRRRIRVRRMMMI